MADDRTVGRLADEIRRELNGVLPARVAVLCVGNRARGDDGFGPAVAAGLRGRVRGRLVDGGATPENELPRIASFGPDAVVLVDAVHFGGGPGEVRALPVAGLREDDVSTHAGSLAVLAEFLSVSCGARSFVLAAQPASVGSADCLSAEMAQAVAQTVAALSRVLGGRPASQA